MRQAFIKALEKEAQKDKRIFLLTADLGYGVFESFAQKYKERFINMGVAEANMMAFAAGLSLSGKIPFVYSISTFITMRCYEQIRNDVCLQNTNVKVVGVGGGLHYGPAGPTHHALEDIAITRVLPNMTILCPCDPNEAYQATKAALKVYGPVYLRLGRSGEKSVYEKIPQFHIGKGVILKSGKDLTIISTGSLVLQALEAAQSLEKRGLEITVVNMPTLKPLDSTLILTLAQKTKNVFTLEEHHIIGGLGSAVAEILSESNLKGINFKRFGIPDEFTSEVGSQEYLQDYFSLSVRKLTQQILKILSKNA